LPADQVQIAAVTPDLQAAFGDAMRVTLLVAALLALTGAAAALLVRDQLIERVPTTELAEATGD
jgi:hypothetical protein